MNKIKIASITIIASVLLSLFVWFCGATNFETPAGYVGYIRQGSIFGKSKFIGTQSGPTSSGLMWLVKGQNVSVTPYTENEIWTSKDSVLAQDKLPMQLSAHLTWKIKEDRVADFMENYGGWEDVAKVDEVESSAYEHFIRQPFRNLVRDEISKYPGLNISENLGKIASDIHKALVEQFKDTPFIVVNSVIGTCIPPENVTEQIAKKVAVQQELERKQTELQIAEKQEAIQTATGKAAAALELETARGRAASMAAIKKELTPEYLTYEAIKGFNGANRVYIPLGGNGLPIVGNLGIDETTPLVAPLPQE